MSKETSKDGWPERYDLFPKVRMSLDLLRFAGSTALKILTGSGQTLASHGDHFVERGAAQELDAALYDQDQGQLWDETNVVELYPLRRLRGLPSHWDNPEDAA